MLNKSNMYEYQKRAVQFVKDNKRSYLMLDMGLGKTTSTLTAVADLIDDFDICKVLIIAPLKVANTVWKQESEKWGHLNKLDIRICTGNLAERTKAFSENHDIYVINREQVEWLIDHKKKWDFDMVVVDEASSFKSSTSKRFKALKKVSALTSRFVLLSGTPAPQGYIDLWAQYFLLDRGERLCRTKSNYLNLHFSQGGYLGKVYSLSQGMDKVIQSKISDITLTMRSEDYLQLPEMISLTEKVTLPKPIMNKYKELKNEMLLTIKSGVDISSPSAAGLNNKLLQFCSGAVYDEDGNTHVIHNEKIDALKDFIECNPNENILVAYNFRSDLARLKQAFPEAVVLDKEGKCIEDWNKGNIKLLLAHPMSAGHGLNLQFGGSVIVYFSLGYNLEYYQQFNKRLHRNGQNNSVRVVHIVVEGGVDEVVIQALNTKAHTQSDLIDSLKNYFLKSY